MFKSANINLRKLVLKWKLQNLVAAKENLLTVVRQGQKIYIWYSNKSFFLT